VQELVEWADGLGTNQGDGSNPMRAMLRKAMAAAKEEVDKTKRVLAACGWGTGDGKLSEYDVRAAQDLAAKVDVEGIVKMLGRLKAAAAHCRRVKPSTHGQELVGITQDNDVSRLLPQEAAFLDEDLEVQFYSRWLNRQLLCYELAAPKGDERGPFVVLLDGSGSMQGDRWTVATAVGLACVKLAVDQKRQAWGVTFASHTLPTKDLRYYRDAMNWLQSFPSGGTNYDKPLTEAIGLIGNQVRNQSTGQPDVLIITDGACRVHDHGVVAKLRELGVRVHVVLVQEGYPGAFDGWAASVSKIENMLRPELELSGLFDSLA